MVEHDAETLLACDHLVEVGPGPGTEGGESLFEGTLEGGIHSKESGSGSFLSGHRWIERNGKCKKPENYRFWLSMPEPIIYKINVFRLGCSRWCGVMGSEKLTGYEVLAKSAAQLLHRSKQLPGAHGGIDGLENLTRPCG